MILALSGALGCKKSGAPHAGRAGVPEMSLIELYKYSPSSDLEDRMGDMPDKLLGLYRLMDGRKDYKAYEPTKADKALVIKYLRLLPPVFERVFREKCVGLYFVRGFAGNGLTSWVVDAKGNLYFHMVLNPEALKNDLSVTLTERESSCFIPAAGARVTVSAGKKYKGLAYALFHEGAHAVDYIKRITPLVEPEFPERYRPAVRQPGDVFTGVWLDYSLPRPGNDYGLRDRITFYSLGGGPKLAFSEAAGLYRGLAGSPFSSLYGSKSWAEDFAELTAFDMITQKLGQPYKITLSVPGAKSLVFEPMRSSSALIRAEKVMKGLESL